MINFSRLFFIFCFVVTFSIQGDLFSEIVGTIERIYRFPERHGRSSYFVLEGGYSLHAFNKKTGRWKVGDQLAVSDEGEEDDDDEVFLKVKNETRKEKRTLLKCGWASPQPNAIVKTGYQRVHGDEIVTIALDNGTSWKFEYFDETAHAKTWKKGDHVVIFIRTPDNQRPDFNGPFSAADDIDMINLDAKSKNAHGEYAIPVL